VGTKFSVRRDDDDIRVIVTEGKVRFEAAEGEAAGSSDTLEARAPGRGGPAADRTNSGLLSAGAVARASGQGVIVRSTSAVGAEELLSWRSGYVVLHDTTLAEAAAEFNRYSERKILIEDPAVAALTLSGKFRANNCAGFVRLLEESFSVRSQYFPDRIVLTGGPQQDAIEPVREP
jgi:transmembrane sensor